MTLFVANHAARHDKIVAGDYDGDSKTDLAVYRSSLGAWLISAARTTPSSRSSSAQPQTSPFRQTTMPTDERT